MSDNTLKKQFANAVGDGNNQEQDGLGVGGASLSFGVRVWEAKRNNRIPAQPIKHYPFTTLFAFRFDKPYTLHEILFNIIWRLFKEFEDGASEQRIKIKTVNNRKLFNVRLTHQYGLMLQTLIRMSSWSVTQFRM